MDQQFTQIINQAQRVIKDKAEELSLATTCLLSGSHLLIEDMPGLGKTTLVLTLAKLMGLDSRRVQFTVDTLPTDVLGSSVFNQKENEFLFHRGPIFTHLLLADELNRTSPRTQSALLQAMEEGLVSIDGKTYTLETPFMVIATQNPLLQSGTFPLPESQLDRFGLSLELKYASEKAESQLFQSPVTPREVLANLEPVFSIAQLLNFQTKAHQVTVSATVADYVTAILNNSRRSNFGQQPLSTRAGLSILRLAKTWALIQERDFVIPEDIQKFLVPCFGHRLGGNSGLKQGRLWAQQLKDETQVS